MTVHILKAVAWALTVHILVNSFFFLLSMGRPIDFLLRLLFSLLVPIVLGITAVIFSRTSERDASASKYQLLAGLGVIGGYVGSLFYASTVPLSEDYTMRMIALNISQIAGGVLVQGALRLMFQLRGLPR